MVLSLPKNKESTRYFSSKQEDYIAKLVGGHTQPNSGAAKFAAGDVVTDDWLFECKTSIKAKQSFAIKKDWINKNEKERMGLQKPYSALVFQFEENGENFFVINEKTFKKLLDKFSETC